MALRTKLSTLRLLGKSTSPLLPFPKPYKSPITSSKTPLKDIPFPANNIPSSFFPARFLSSSVPPESHQGPEAQPQLRHQEIVGPTVDRDDSPLANETRQVLDNLRKSIYDLSSSLAVLGVANLGLGSWILYSLSPPHEVAVQGLLAFAFPFSMAFLMRRAVKPISFFRKMEEQGRLQILTLALQVSKNVNLLFVRTRIVTYCCVVGVSAGSLVAVLAR